MLILLRVSICNPLVAKTFTGQSLEDPFKLEEDLENTYQYIVVGHKTRTVTNAVRQYLLLGPSSRRQNKLSRL